MGVPLSLHQGPAYAPTWPSAYKPFSARSNPLCEARGSRHSLGHASVNTSESPRSTPSPYNKQSEAARAFRALGWCPWPLTATFLAGD